MHMHSSHLRASLSPRFLPSPAATISHKPPSRRAFLAASNHTRAPPSFASPAASLLVPLSTNRRAHSFSIPLTTRTFTTSAARMSDGTVKEVSSKKEYLDALGQDSGLVVLDCYATWCGPCKIISPKVEEMAKKYTSVRFYKVDVDKVPDVAQELGVRAMPTFMYFKDGDKVDDVLGANPAAIESAITKNM